MNSSMKIRCRKHGAALALWLVHGVAFASCGATFCTINTDWDTQAPWQNDTSRLDLRMEYIHQDQPRSETAKVGGGGHHREVETYNRNWVLGLSHAFAPDWNLSVQIPVVSRNHLHIHHHQGVPIPENWDFTRLGDIRVLTHVRLDAGTQAQGTFGLIGGIKLPTGSIKVRNGDGDVAERSLQPGSGSSDLIAGGFISGRLAQTDWHAQLRWQHAVLERQGYQPGDQVGLDAGISYPLGSVHALAQVNLLWRGHDQGANAEPADSGGRYIFFSPGVAWSIGRDMQLYGLVQLPVYQNVRGIQLTADWAATVGLTMRF
jgi:hypothetical protein